jgi:hypothetical protein
MVKSKEPCAKKSGTFAVFRSLFYHDYNSQMMPCSRKNPYAPANAPEAREYRHQTPVRILFHPDAKFYAKSAYCALISCLLISQPSCHSCIWGKQLKSCDYFSSSRFCPFQKISIGWWQRLGRSPSLHKQPLASLQ